MTKKFIAGAIAAMSIVSLSGFGLVAMPTASAQTTAELQAQIAALLAQISALQGQIGGNASAKFTFTRDLTVGSQGEDVRQLQIFLNAHGAVVASAGAGSPGMESTYFGPLTRMALAKFQAANGIAPAAGYFGPITRAKVHAMMGGTTGGGTTPPPSSGGGDDDLDGGETSIEEFDVNDADDTDVEEGASEVEVAEIEFDVEDADAELVRADFIFDGSSNTSGGEDQPWKVFDNVYLMNGSDVIAEMASDDEDDWTETDVDDIYRIRLTGINEVFNEGDNVMLTLAVDVASSVDAAGTDADWTVEVAQESGDADGFRFTDGEGLETEEGSDETASFEIVEAGEENDFSLSTSSDDPEATAIEVEDDDTSDEATIFVFTVEADEDSDEDLEVEDFAVDLTVGNPSGGDASITQDHVIDDVTVVIDGEEFDADAATTDTDDTIADSATDTASYEVDLEDGDFVIASGEEADVEVHVTFRALDGSATSYDESTTIFAAVDSADFDVIGVDSDEDVADPSDTVTGETHTLATSGFTVTGVSDDADRTFVADDSGEFDQGTFIIVFEVTAFGEDLFVDKSTPVEDNDGSEVSTALSYSVSNPGSNSTVGTLSATGGDFDEETNSYRINEGETAEFTLEVTVTASADSSAEVALQAIGYALSDANGTNVYIVPDEPEFKTNSITLLAA